MRMVKIQSDERSLIQDLLISSSLFQTSAYYFGKDHEKCSVSNWIFHLKMQLTCNLLLSKEDANCHISSLALHKTDSCVTADGAFMSLLAK